MEGDSEGERSNESKKIGVGSNSNHPSNDGGGGSGQQSVKPKRQMKTPFQLETLEKAYACMYFLFYFNIFLFNDLIGR